MKNNLDAQIDKLVEEPRLCTCPKGTTHFPGSPCVPKEPVGEGWWSKEFDSTCFCSEEYIKDYTTSKCSYDKERLSSFISLVEAKTIERCAEVATNYIPVDNGDEYTGGMIVAANDIAQAITKLNKGN